MTFDAPTADELPLIFDSWSRSFRKSDWAGCVPNHKWDEVSRVAIAELLERSVCIVALAPRVPGIFEGRRVMGYAVCEPNYKVLHWLYVKDDYRRQGIGRALLREVRQGTEGWKYTHRTAASRNFLGADFTWDPVPARVRR